MDHLLLAIEREKKPRFNRTITTAIKNYLNMKMAYIPYYDGLDPPPKKK